MRCPSDTRKSLRTTSGKGFSKESLWSWSISVAGSVRSLRCHGRSSCAASPLLLLGVCVSIQFVEQAVGEDPTLGAYLARYDLACLAGRHKFQIAQGYAIQAPSLIEVSADCADKVVNRTVIQAAADIVMNASVFTHNR
jgi:hypothetical protein